jgi:uncharacterized cupin superfamily protein
MKDILITGLFDALPLHKNEHKDYEYYKRELVTSSDNGQCAVSVYEIPPGKAAYPYHFHTQNEENFYIISGTGVLKTPTGENNVSAGNFLHFPTGEQGAHKLTNTSETETLVYIDFDTRNPVDIAFYPDSGKVGFWGKGLGQVFKLNNKVDYYDGE